MIGRPEPNEAKGHFWTYINQVPGEDPVAALRAQLDELATYGQEISEEASLHRYAPGKWSRREALCHMADTERVFMFRAFWFARGLTGPLPGFDQDMVNTHAGADAVSWAALVEEFRRVRLATLSLLEHLPAEGWSRSGVASGNEVTVRALVFATAGHFAHHLKILRERY